MLETLLLGAFYKNDRENGLGEDSRFSLRLLSARRDSRL